MDAVGAVGEVGSLPSRGAWIEMYPWRWTWSSWWRRSPHGERGLKSEQVRDYFKLQRVAPLTGSVD